MAYPLDLKLTVVRHVLSENISVSDVAAKYGLSDACVRNWLKSEELTVSALLEADDARNLAKTTPPAGLKQKRLLRYTLLLLMQRHIHQQGHPIFVAYMVFLWMILLSLVKA